MNDLDLQEEIQTEVAKQLKKDPAIVPIIMFGLIVILLLVSCFFSVPNYLNAQKTGDSIGSTAGKAVGHAMGTFTGATEYRKSYEEGKEKGLSAEDIETEIYSILPESKSNLEVLVATVSIEDVNKVGDSYAALFLLRGDAVFTVDLGQATFEKASDSELLIQLPPVMCVVNLDDTRTEKIAEYQRSFFGGSREDGYQEFLNSVDQIEQDAENRIGNYNELLERAQEAAIKQVKQLAESVCTSDTGITNVSVLFVGGEGRS